MTHDSTCQFVAVTARTHPSLFNRVRCTLKDVPFNTLFAWSVVDGLVDGNIWCDRERDPTFAHVMHPYGMTLLLALSADLDFPALKRHIHWCRQTTNGLWMQVHPQSLADEIDEVFDVAVASHQPASNEGGVKRFTRSNFLFVPARCAPAAPTQQLSNRIEVRPMTAEDYALPEFGVSPRHFWRNADDFLANGGGWCVVDDTRVVAIAFSSFRLGSQLEIGVETHPLHRGRGFARHAASAIIDECVASGIEPVWSCRKQNVPSYHLAQTLGFQPTMEGAYYHLPKLA